MRQGQCSSHYEPAHASVSTAPGGGTAVPLLHRDRVTGAGLARASGAAGSQGLPVSGGFQYLCSGCSQ